MSSDRLLVESNPWDGIAEYAHFDSDGNLLGIQQTADLTHIVEACKRLQNDGSKGYGKTREWKHVGMVHPGLLLKWAEEKGVSYDFINSKEGFENIVLKYLYSSDYKNLRVDI